MGQASLSTMWAQRRFEKLSDFVATAERLGFTGMEINYTVSPESLEELLSTSQPIVPSLHAPMPRVQAGGTWSEELNLAAIDEEERRLAVACAKTTIDWAAELGAKFVVLHLGGVGNDMFEAEKRLRVLYDTNNFASEEVPFQQAECHRLRAEGARKYFPKAKETLHELAEHASRYGIALGLEDRYHYHEIPSIDETIELLDEFPPEVVGYWHDMGHAEVIGRLGLYDKYRWLREVGSRCIGSHLHDVTGIGDHRAPGEGDADWDYVVNGLPQTALRVLEINQHTPEEQMATVIPFLKEKGLI
jgi:sugar phosphate isomerase/epimerase